jgi:predicted ABC-type ATPase
MAYKIIVVAPAAGGKSSLVNFLRAHTDLTVREIDEEILRANDYSWPEDRDYKETVIVPNISQRIIDMDSVVYFTYRMPIDFIRKARDRGFEVIMLNVGIAELERRNLKRMAEEGYDDISHWFDVQLRNYADLNRQGLIDRVLDGQRPTPEIAQDIIKMAEGRYN